MFDNIMKFFKKLGKKEKQAESSDTAKERLHLVLMQDRANVSADFLELMREEIIEVIKKYIDIDEKAIDVRLTNKTNDDGTVGAPALYANIPIVTIKNEARIANVPHDKKQEGNKKEEDNKENQDSLKEDKKIESKDEPKKEDEQEKENKKEQTKKTISKSKTENKENAKKKEYKQDKQKVEKAKQSKAKNKTTKATSKA